jgi:hypothetical protein
LRRTVLALTRTREPRARPSPKISGFGARTSVIVNGTPVVENATYTGRCPARFCGVTVRAGWLMSLSLA